jgi:uncharacterized repeat protein (TIGR03803 family)
MGDWKWFTSLVAVLACGLVLRAGAQTNYQRLKSFGFPELSGENPISPVVLGSDGLLYGATRFGGTNLTGGCIYRVKRDGSGYIAIHMFNPNGVDGRGPNKLIEGSDGALYGTTLYRNTNDAGTIFKLKKDGSEFVTLWNLDGTNLVKDYWQTQLPDIMEASDGTLYGTCPYGGTSGGYIFKLNRDGSGFAVLHNFARPTLAPPDGFSPLSGVMEASNGALYGTTQRGDTNYNGTIFKLDKDGSNYAVLHHFGSIADDGNGPVAGLIEGSDSMLYGTTPFGGIYNRGTVFRLCADGSDFAILHSLAYSQAEEGTQLSAALVEGIGGALYGTASAGGPSNAGTVFMLNKDGTGFTVLHGFTGYLTKDGASPLAPLVRAGDGTLFGTAYADFSGGGRNGGAIFKLNANGDGYANLFGFGFAGDGLGPGGDLIEGSDGALYGTTSGGGPYGVGTVFKLNKDGSGYSALHNFNGSDGRWTYNGLLEGSDGMLYGSTYAGGEARAGTIFKLKKDGGSFSVIRTFTTNTGDGTQPFGSLREGSDGALYGTTVYGGTLSGFNGSGTMFKLNKDGSGFVLLHVFPSIFYDYDGSNPYGSLLKGTDGAFYGTTYRGGSYGHGIVFKINQDGTGYTVLRSLTGSPHAGVTEGADGTLYGALVGSGKLFKINKDGSGYVELYSFVLRNDNMPGPLAWANGVLYGIAAAGGSGSYGIAFKLNQDGSGFEVLHAFAPVGGDGISPTAALLHGSDGAFYGVTGSGGDYFGTVFRLFSGPPSIIVASPKLDGSGAVLRASGGAAGQTYAFEGAEQLGTNATWRPIGSATAAIDGSFQFRDSNPPNYSARFYRGAVP